MSSNSLVEKCCCSVLAALVSDGGIGTSGLLAVTLTGLFIVCLVALVTVVFTRRCCHDYVPIKVALLGRRTLLNTNIYRTSPRG